MITQALHDARRRTQDSLFRQANQQAAQIKAEAWEVLRKYAEITGDEEAVFLWEHYPGNRDAPEHGRFARQYPTKFTWGREALIFATEHNYWSERHNVGEELRLPLRALWSRRWWSQLRREHG